MEDGILTRRSNSSQGSASAAHWQMEVGRLQYQLEQALQSNQNIRDVAADSTTRLARADEEIRALTVKLRRADDENCQQKSEITRLKEQLRQASTTIKVQSDQISGAKDRGKFSTPHKAITSSFTDVYNLPPPTYQLTDGKSPSTDYHCIDDQHFIHTPERPSTAIGRNPSYSNFSTVTPEPKKRPSSGLSGSNIARQQRSEQGRWQNSKLRGSFNSKQPNHNDEGHLSTALSTLSLHREPSFDEGRRPSFTFTTEDHNGELERRPSMQLTTLANLATVRHSVRQSPSDGLLLSQSSQTFNQNRANLPADLNNFFHQVEEYTRRFASVPDKFKDAVMPAYVKQLLSQITNHDQAMSLIARSTTRFHAVAKVINHEICTFVFRPALVRNFRPDFDEKWLALRDQRNTGMAQHVRRALFEAESDLLKEMMAVPTWDQWIDNLVSSKTTNLWQLLSHFLSSGENRKDAYQQLRLIYADAVRIGLAMIQKISLFIIEFPPIAATSYFNPGNMIGRDAWFVQDSPVAAKMKLKVRMAATPVVTETDFTSSHGVSTKIIHLANVLLEE